ncbi:MAG: peptidase [Stygiobacter sp. RIFOXYC12_FULL_38_8]|nr:MAG: peptidase [Stygiobacter sp. GWC2_38_9]OGV09153.1 MAG: peptidase [Stygiobacter sp. RIFOXYB2_FULL_37_11]OGV16380.1 MAG: peptidase [Stygiobacter sp. RIFOXYC2_FULL_38_25]OGV29637.1 MAG: peptidase [Stygiobacter sp. RIFOXYC12_FULL_38_8]OGV81528.1 MAG: peptidase [Stygiobacter sp. GWF2_38_21]
MTEKSILNLQYEKYKLGNGLEVILYQDNSLPSIAVNIWYRVGSANEVKSKTGFAHLFEHMMFQGSENIPKEGHFRYIQEAGGNLNGSTSIDRTNYYETLPSNYLELALWLESDRMGFMLPGLTQEKLDNQKDVVMNERRQRYENQPYGLSWEILFSNLFPEGHPYSWPTIGWMEDIAKFELDDVRNFFKTYYVPNNATLVVGGNFETASTKDLVEKYFGGIQAGNSIPEIVVEKQTLNESKKVVHKDNVQLPRIYLAWHTDKAFSADDAVLDILSEVLSSGKSSRFYKSLVIEKQIAQDVSSFQYSARLAGSFIVASTAKPGVELDTIKEVIFERIHDLIQNGIKEEELLRSKNSVISSFVYSLQKLDTITDQMNHYNFYLGEPNSFSSDLARYESVTGEEVISTAKKYLLNPFVELHIIPNTKEND